MFIESEGAGAIGKEIAIFQRLNIGNKNMNSFLYLVESCQLLQQTKSKLMGFKALIFIFMYNISLLIRSHYID